MLLRLPLILSALAICLGVSADTEIRNFHLPLPAASLSVPGPAIP